MSMPDRGYSLSPKQVARALGGEAYGLQVSAPGPGHSPRDRSLSVRLDPAAPSGFVVHSHAGDDPILCRDYVRQRLGLPSWQPGDEQGRIVAPSHIEQFDRGAIEQETGPRHLNEDDLLRIKRARQIWADAGDPRGSIAERYLNGRKLELTPDLANHVLRFHPHCPWRHEAGQSERVPALIAAFRSIDDNEITAIHRIALNPDGTKRDRRMLGVVHRAAVKLDPGDGDTLAIGEGVETAMAGRQLGYMPAWALGSVGAISFFPLLKNVKTLLIFAETGKASADAIQFCGRRWYRAHRRVRIVRPTVGSDLNDQFEFTKVDSHAYRRRRLSTTTGSAVHRYRALGKCARPGPPMGCSKPHTAPATDSAVGKWRDRQDACAVATVRRPRVGTRLARHVAGAGTGHLSRRRRRARRAASPHRRHHAALQRQHV